MTIPLLILAIPSVIAGYWTGFFPYLNPSNQPLNIPHLLSLPDTWIGVAVSLVNYLDELPFFCEEVLPRLQRSGLRDVSRV